MYWLFIFLCSLCFVPIFDIWYQQEKLCSKGRPESAIGEHLKTEIIPDVEKLQKVAFSSRAFYSVASIFPQGCPIHECIYILLWNQDLCLAARYEAHTLLL